MPGNFRRNPPRPARPAPGLNPAGRRPLPPRPIPPPPARRPLPGAIHRAANPNRLEQRNQRLQEARRVAERLQSHPRPAVRPLGAPRKVMPANQPPAARLRLAQGVKAAMAQPPPRPPVGLRQPAAPAAAAAAGILGAVALNAAAAHADVSAEASALKSDLESLEQASALAEVQADLANIDAALRNALALLESARSEGYRFQNDLEQIAHQAMSQWESILPQAEQAVATQSQALQSRLVNVYPQVQRLNAVLGSAPAAAPLLRSTHAQVNALLQEAGQIQDRLESSYSAVESQAQQLNARLTQIHWALDQLAEARFRLEAGEELVMAAPTRWDREGKDDPEGVLYLSTRRLVFERKEKVAVKKILFITTASELVQEVLIDQPLAQVKACKAANRGLFGHHDYVEVQFADPSLGQISFHLDGQDSEDWISLIERARSGRIEDERASGAGLSFAEMGGPLTRADIVALQGDVNELQDEAMLKASRRELAELETEVRALERKLANLRARGYVIERDLEADLAVLAAQWERVKANTEATLEQQSRLLGEQMTRIQADLASLAGASGNLQAARPAYLKCRSLIASLEAQADAAAMTVLAQYDSYADEIQSFAAHLEWVGWMLEAIASASFRLLATESGVAATEALWQGSGVEPENGILFLTDQRLLWEDRVGAFELKLEVPLQQVLEVRKETDPQAEAESLAFTFAAGAPLPATSFQLSLPVADSWLKMIGRAKAGEYVQDRAVPLDPAEVERVRNAPRQCTKCGAALTAPILRGQREIRCEYCGQAMGI